MTTMPRSAVEIHPDARLTLDDLLAIVHGSTVTIHPDAIALMQASQDVVTASVERGDHIYGTTAGLGHSKDRRLAADDIVAYQTRTLLGHEGAFGPSMPAEVSRATLAVRLNALARGGGGCSPALATTMADMLNKGVTPVLPLVGSVGAADLGHMAALGMALIGHGKAEVDGVVVDAAEALRRAGIEPVRLGFRDGHAILVSNALAIGHAALVLERAQRAVELAELCWGLSLEAVRGNLSVIHPFVAKAKQVPGQAAAASHMRSVLSGTYLGEPGVQITVQDPLSIRTGPQVFGALREVLRQAAEACEIQINAADENPVVSVEDQLIIHNGNFHSLHLAMMFDLLRVAFGHVALTSERRMNHVVFRSTGDPAIWGETMWRPALRGALLYPAAARVAEIRQLCGPATLDCPPLDLNIEDHATSTPLTVRKTEDVIDMIEDVLTIELMLAAQMIVRGDGTVPQLGAGTAVAHATVMEVLAEHPHGTPVPELHAAVKAALRGDLLERADRAAREAAAGVVPLGTNATDQADAIPA